MVQSLLPKMTYPVFGWNRPSSGIKLRVVVLPVKVFLVRLVEHGMTSGHLIPLLVLKEDKGQLMNLLLCVMETPVMERMNSRADSNRLDSISWREVLRLVLTSLVKLRHLSSMQSVGIQH
jgi:hypothetical protein